MKAVCQECVFVRHYLSKIWFMLSGSEHVFRWKRCFSFRPNAKKPPKGWLLHL